MKQLVKSPWLRLLLSPLLILVLAMSLLLACQRHLIFFPDSLPPTANLQQTGADEQVYMDTEDGETIHALWFETDSPHDSYTLLYFHGNAGNVVSWAPVARRFQNMGLNVLLVDYRGYGKSSGSISEDGLYLDGRAAYRALQHRQIDPDKIIVHGRSLGAAVATELATARPIAGLVLETPFTHLGDMARDLYKVRPPSWLLRFEFDNLSRAAHIDTPTWVVHGTDDGIVPIDHGRAVYKALDNPWRMTVIDGGGHNDLMSFPHYQRDFLAFLDHLGESP